MGGYRDDVAYVHDAGFSDFSLNAAPGLLRVLRRCGITSGLVTDLGCGSGRWARELGRAGYDVFGVDQSAAFIRMARKTAPRARFVVASLHSVKLPARDAVTSLGECFNYCFDRGRGLARLFARVYRALRPAGAFIFDVAGPARIPESAPQRRWFQGRDWAILVETAGKQNALTRQIICFRKVGRLYRRTEEIHRLRLYGAAEVVEELGGAGFEVQALAGYGRFRFPVGITGLVARKR